MEKREKVNSIEEKYNVKLLFKSDSECYRHLRKAGVPSLAKLLSLK